MVAAGAWRGGAGAGGFDLLMRPDLLDWLRCPSCGGSLEDISRRRSVRVQADLASPAEAGHDEEKHAEGAVRCRVCALEAPIRNGIPRFVDVPEDATARRTQASFGYEWTHFNDWKPSGETNFNDYFQALDLESLRSAVVLDGGCGMGRHARQIARFARRVVAIDFSRAIDQAAANTADAGNVDCVQGDLLALPVADGSFDFAYSLGVLHHLDRTEHALARLVRALKPGGRLRIYLYWKRHGWKGRLLDAVTVARQVTTRMPFPVLRAFCRVLSFGLFGGVVLPYRALSTAGVRGIEEWPLFVYSKYPFNVLYNDQFDRFSAPIEKRYDPDEVRDLLARAGLVNITVRPCFGWLGDGIKPV